MKVYPIFLNDLAGRRCLVIGGGREAESKIRGLLACDADVAVISPDPPEPVPAMAREGLITWIARAYRVGDLKDAFLVIVTQPRLENMEAIWREGASERALVNAMDDIPHCSFVAGSIVRRGKLVVSISTSGAAPALSVRLRQELEGLLEQDFESFLDLMSALRPPMAEHVPDFDERRRLWYEIVDSDILGLITDGRRDVAMQRLAGIIGGRFETDLIETPEVA